MGLSRHGAAKDAVRRLTGVLGITDLLTVKPRLSPAGIQTKIEQAFKRSAEVDAGVSPPR